MPFASPALQTDQETTRLLERIAQGDASAVETVYRQYYGTVSAFVRMQIADSGAVEEIVDDVFMVLFSSASQFRGESAFKTWLLGIARNLCHNWLRQMSREPVAGMDVTDEELSGLMDQAWPALDHLQQQQIQAIVRLCLDRLPPPQKEALFWVFFEEMSLEETAKALSCAIGTVKSRLFHAKAKVADCVKRRLSVESLA